MKRWIFTAILGVTLLGAVVAAGARPSPGPATAHEVHALEFAVHTPDGRPIALHFTVRADSVADAHSAARAAAQQLLPEVDLDVAEGRAEAAYAFWSHTWRLDQLPVPVAYNPAGAPVTVTEDHITAGIQPWNAVETSAFRITYTGLTDRTPGAYSGDLDGQNTIGWANLDCSEGCVLGVAAAGEGEVDIVLNSNPVAGLGDGAGFSVDTGWVVLHEVGHLAGLEHSCDPRIEGDCEGEELDAVMYPLYRGGVRSLGAYDIGAISALYPRAEEPIAPPAGSTDPDSLVELNRGWNLVVLPPGPLESTARALRCVDAIYAFIDGEWRVWLRDAAPSLNTLTVAEEGMGFWLHSTGTCGLSFTAVS